MPDESETRIIDTILIKFIQRRNNFLEYKAFENNKISNVYAGMNEKEHKYSNTKYVKEFIDLLKQQDIKDQIIASTKVLFSLYDISDEPVRNEINEYWQLLSKENTDETDLQFEFYYTLILRLELIDLYNVTKEQWKRLEKYLNNQKGDSSQSHVIYQLCSFLLDKNKDSNTSECTEVIENIINILDKKYKIYDEDRRKSDI